MIMIMMYIIHKLRQMISKLKASIELVRKSLTFNCWIIKRTSLIMRNLRGGHHFGLQISARAIVLIGVILIN
jgi:hypothetical protein